MMSFRDNFGELEHQQEGNKQQNMRVNVMEIDLSLVVNVKLEKLMSVPCTPTHLGATILVGLLLH